MSSCSRSCSDSSFNNQVDSLPFLGHLQHGTCCDGEKHMVPHTHFKHQRRFPSPRVHRDAGRHFRSHSGQKGQNQHNAVDDANCIKKGAWLDAYTPIGSRRFRASFCREDVVEHQIPLEAGYLPTNNQHRQHVPRNGSHDPDILLAIASTRANSSGLP